MPARKRTKAQAAQIYARLSVLRPDPRTELDYFNAFTLLVAVVLSAQATDKGVNKATAILFRKADTPEKMAALGEDGIAAHIKTIGLWRNKAKNVLALSQKLISDHGGEVPTDRENLEALPGVGRKTANVVLAEAFGQQTIAVDTHVFRVANRTGLAIGKTPDAVEAGLMKVTPPEYLAAAHHWLILHGRYTCLARAPKCEACAVADLCAAQPAFEKEKRQKALARMQSGAQAKASAKAPAKRSAARGAKLKNK
jgi:endonuclease III